MSGVLSLMDSKDLVITIPNTTIKIAESAIPLGAYTSENTPELYKRISTIKMSIPTHANIIVPDFFLFL